MTFFESLLALLAVAIALLQVSRRFGLPYPAMLAAAGILVAFVPGSPRIMLDPDTALALFIAPVLLDAAYDFSADAARRYWRPLVLLAVVAVLLTACVVAWIGRAFANLPLGAALALGAIVAPPDAAAAVAVLGAVTVPKSTAYVLKGESLFNDATALLLFGAALAIQSNGGLDGGVLVQLGLAAPAAVLLGMVFAWGMRYLTPVITRTLGATVLQFVVACAVWVVADRLRVSAVLCEAAFAMAVARNPQLSGVARMRVHSYAVWATVVFLLNVIAFLLVGMQVRTILARTQSMPLGDALSFAAIVIAAVILTRLVVVMAFNRLSARFVRFRGPEVAPPTARQGLLVGWCGMRGLVTLVTALALPAEFPRRDLIVLTAFAVVLATLIVQGLTLAPLIRWLRLHVDDTGRREFEEARARLLRKAVSTLDAFAGPEAQALRYGYAIHDEPAPAGHSLERYRKFGLAAIAAQRELLQELRNDHQVDDNAYLFLQEELDWNELTLLPDEERRIEEG